VRRITVEQIDAFMAKMSRQGWCGHSLKSLAAGLRTFFRYLEMNGTLRQSLAEKVGGILCFETADTLNTVNVRDPAFTAPKGVAI
jgi:hypothetical protein